MTLTHPDKTGAARMGYFWARALRSAGHEVALIHGRVPASNILDEMKEAGVESHLEQGLAFPLSRSVHRRVATWARAWGSTVLLGLSQRDIPVALEAAHRLRIHAVASLQSTHKFWGPWPLAQLKRWYYTYCVRRYLSLAVCVSRAVHDEAVGMLGIPEKSVVTVPNGIDVQRFVPCSPEERARTRRSLGLGDSELMLLNVGRLDPQKGQDLLLESLQSLRSTNWKLFVVGEVTTGPGQGRGRSFQAELRRLAGPRVTMLGWRDDIPSLLGAADAYVHAARYEGPPGGLVVLEAMACSLPTVCTDCSGLLEGFEEGVHGFMAATGSAAALASSLERLLELSPDERASMGRCARGLVETGYDIRVRSREFVRSLEERCT